MDLLNKNADAYLKALLTIGNGTSGLTTDLNIVQDGRGTASPLSLSSTSANIDSNLNVNSLSIEGYGQVIDSVGNWTGVASTSGTSGTSSIPVYDANTWNPTITSTGGTLPTFSIKQGTYTRIGRLCFFNVHMYNSLGGTAGSGSNHISLVFPFTTSADQLDVRVPLGTTTNGTNEDIIYIEILTSSSSGLLYRQTNTAGEPELVPFTNADLNSSTIRHINGSTKILI